MQMVPEATGRMLPEAATMVAYDAAPAPSGDATCAYYPRTDALFSPPMGWRGAVMTSATFKANAGYDGECNGSAATIGGWRWYTLGQTAL